MSAHASHHESLHERVSDVSGAGDLRLLYGMLVPLLVALAFILAMVLGDLDWFVPVMMVIVLVFTGIVVAGLNAMLREDVRDEDREAD